MLSFDFVDRSSFVLKEANLRLCVCQPTSKQQRETHTHRSILPSDWWRSLVSWAISGAHHTHTECVSRCQTDTKHLRPLIGPSGRFHSLPTDKERPQQNAREEIQFGRSVTIPFIRVNVLPQFIFQKFRLASIERSVCCIVFHGSNLKQKKILVPSVLFVC